MAKKTSPTPLPDPVIDPIGPTDPEPVTETEVSSVDIPDTIIDATPEVPSEDTLPVEPVITPPEESTSEESVTTEEPVSGQPQDEYQAYLWKIHGVTPR